MRKITNVSLWMFTVSPTKGNSGLYLAEKFLNSISPDEGHLSLWTQDEGGVCAEEQQKLERGYHTLNRFSHTPKFNTSTCRNTDGNNSIFRRKNIHFNIISANNPLRWMFRSEETHLDRLRSFRFWYLFVLIFLRFWFLCSKKTEVPGHPNPEMCVEQRE